MWANKQQALRQQLQASVTDREQLCSSPEFGAVAADGDCLRHVEGVLEDKLHVVGGAQAGEEQVLRGDGAA